MNGLCYGPPAPGNLGAGDARIIFKHIMPNLFHFVIVRFVLNYVGVIKSEVLLAYLGLLDDDVMAEDERSSAEDADRVSNKDVISILPPVPTHTVVVTSASLQIERVAGAVKIPVIGSGDCLGARQLIDRMRHGVAGVLVGRGVLRNPWIFRQAADMLALLLMMPLMSARETEAAAVKTSLLRRNAFWNR